MTELMALAADPAVWLALFTLVVMEVVLGIDNLVFVAILSNKLPAAQRGRVRRIGLGLALIMRLGLLSTISWIVGLTQPLLVLPFDIPGEVDLSFSWRDLILIAGGLFLVWKATKEIHGAMNPAVTDDLLDKHHTAITNVGTAIVQIILLDLVFSVDSILTAVGMTDHLPVMVIAVIIAVICMLLAAGPLARFIEKNPTVVMLALGFLMMIGMVLIADGFGYHVPKGYIYAAMAFSVAVEALNMIVRRSTRRREMRRQAAGGTPPIKQRAQDQIAGRSPG